MEKPVFPSASGYIAKKREQLAPETLATFRSFSRQVFAEGELPSKTKELIAVAVAHVTQCPYCIRSHTKSAQAKAHPAKTAAEPRPSASSQRRSP